MNVRNPFLYRTKAIVCSELKSSGLSKLIQQTCSCWKYSRIANMAKQKGKFDFQGKHCGECYPCVMRQIALFNANLSSFEAHTREYLENIFENYPPQNRETRTIIADLLRFAHDIKISSVNDILVKYPEFSIGTGNVDPVKLVEMYKQFANETVNTFKELGNKIIAKRYGFILK